MHECVFVRDIGGEQAHGVQNFRQMLARPLRRDEQAAIDRAAERAVRGLVGSVRQARVRLLNAVTPPQQSLSYPFS